MKIIKIILIASILSLTSCSNKEDKIFEKSATQRVQEMLTKYDKILKEAKYGWHLDHYNGGKEMTGGGTTMTFKFYEENGVKKVKVMHEWFITPFTSNNQVGISEYSLVASGGPVLNFQTNNSIVHSFTTATFMSNLDQYKTEDEYIIMSYKDGIMYLKGKKFGVVTRLIKLKEPMLDYLRKIQDITKYTEENKTIQLKNMEVNKEIIPFLWLTGRVITYEYDDGKQIRTYSTPYVLNDKGMHLYKPVTVNGFTFQNLEFVNEGRRRFFKSEDGKVLIHLADLLPFNLASKTWGLFVENDKVCSSVVANKFKEVSDLIAKKDPTRKLLDKVRFGLTHEGFSGISFFNKTINEEGFKGHLINFNMSYATTDFEELEFKFKSNGRRANDYQELMSFVNFIEQNSPYVCKNISTEKDGKNVFKVKSATNPDVWFTLYKLKSDNQPVEDLP